MLLKNFPFVLNIEIISYSPLRMYILRLTGICLNLLTESPDVYIHRPDISRIIITPDRIQQMVTAVDFIRIQRHQLQQIKFLRCQIDLFSADIQSAAVNNQMKITFFYDFPILFFWSLLFCSADNRLNAGFTSRILNGLVM